MIVRVYFESDRLVEFFVLANKGREKILDGRVDQLQQRHTMDHFIKKQPDRSGDNRLSRIAQHGEENHHDQNAQTRNLHASQEGEIFLQQVIEKIKYHINHINRDADWRKEQ